MPGVQGVFIFGGGEELAGWIFEGPKANFNAHLVSIVYDEHAPDDLRWAAEYVTVMSTRRN